MQAPTAKVQVVPEAHSGVEVKEGMCTGFAFIRQLAHYATSYLLLHELIY